MYGLVNKALEDMVVSSHGGETWQHVMAEAGVDVEMFLTHEGYPDEMTYSLAGAASRALGVPVPELLQRFGVHWVTRTAPGGYGALMDSAGRTVGEFLHSLPGFHIRVGLVFPHLAPPEFTVSDETTHSVRLTYRSSRPGLAPFVVGLLRGIGLRFATPIRIDHVASREAGAEREEFLVEWGGAGSA